MARTRPQVVIDETANFTVGYTGTAYPIGTITTGTVTPDPANGNLQKVTNGGAFTLAAPTASDDYTILIALKTVTGGGTITVTGFTKVTGDTITNANGDKFMLAISNVDGILWLNVASMQ